PDAMAAPDTSRAAVGAAGGPEAVPLLDVRGLSIHFRTGGGELQVTNDVSFRLQPGERVGVVGESGCGKTVTGLSLLGLLPKPPRSRVEGQILFEGRDLLKLSPREMRDIRGRSISMIFQEPMSALDPVFTIGQQIGETIRAHFKVTAREARERAIESLASVGIPLPGKRVDEYPHQLSGGMRQRAMIAVALACEPKLLIADEPTTALDVTVQAQIIDLLRSLSERTGTALLFITHDLGVVAETCERMLTMYAGQVVEDGATDTVLERPMHPYSSGLLRSIPRLSPRKTALPSIPGRVPAPAEMPSGCRFAPRCGHRIAACDRPQAIVDANGHRVRCARHTDLVLPGATEALAT
ncbi:MAG TPA: ABC transporter ATP-binding protein, partial [Quisquiliibacterium sp.]|nr:ABC transporter ATP-binding protein [Quisquiliibacterium sp.]